LVEHQWKINVLVVDDDAADTSLMLEALRFHPRVASAEATDAPDDALMLLAQGRLRPNLILLDISMPKVNGFRFIRALREIPWMRTIPVVMMTTSRFSRDVDHARDLGVCRYVVKPDSYPELEAQIDLVVRQCLAGWS
jgi:CheY-like chemotaxis protein